MFFGSKKLVYYQIVYSFKFPHFFLKYFTNKMTCITHFTIRSHLLYSDSQHLLTSLNVS